MTNTSYIFIKAKSGNEYGFNPETNHLIAYTNLRLSNGILRFDKDITIQFNYYSDTTITNGIAEEHKEFKPIFIDYISNGEWITYNSSEIEIFEKYHPGYISSVKKEFMSLLKENGDLIWKS